MIKTSSECLAITDAHRFVIQHQHLIRKSALHAYTALAFSPEDSTLFRTFRVRYKRMVPRVSSNIPIRWSSHQVLPNQRYVQKIEYGLDGSRIVSLGIGGILQVWDTISASMIARADGIAQFICSPDGRYLIFYSYANNRVCIWDLATGSPKFHAFDPSPEKTALIAPHPHNLYVLVVTNGLNTGLRIWDLEHGIPTQPTIPLEAHIHSLAVSPDSTRLVYVSSTAGNPNTATVVLWNLETSEEIGRYTMTSPGNPSCVKFQPNGQRFITCDGEHGGNGSIYLSHRDTGMIVRRFQGHYQAVWDAIFSAKNDFLASHDKYETKIVLWRLSDFDEPGAIKHLEGHTGTVRYISFSPNGEQIASVSLDQTVRVWDVSSGASLQTFFLGFTGNIYLSFISPDWRQFVTVTHDNQLHVYDITAPAEGIMNREDIEKMSVPIVALSPKTSLAAAQTDTRENSFQLWDLVTMSSLETQHEMGPSPVDKVTALSFSAAGGRIAAGSWRGGIQIWTTIGESRIILSLAPHKEAVQRIVFSPDGGFVASLSSKSIQLLDVDSKAVLHTWPIVAKNHVSDIAFSPDGTEIAAFLCGKGMAVWTILGEAQHTTSKNPPADKIVYSLDGDMLASLHHSVFIALWEMAEGIKQTAKVMLPSTLRVARSLSDITLGISSGEKYLVFGCYIWDLSTSTPRLIDMRKPLPPVLCSDKYPHSLLCLIDGWIYGACAQGRLLPLPEYLHDKPWGTMENRVVIWRSSENPVVIDCSPLLT